MTVRAGGLSGEIGVGPAPWRAGIVHRTRALPHAVNLTFEHYAAETTFVDPPVASGGEDSEVSRSQIDGTPFRSEAAHEPVRRTMHTVRRDENAAEV